MDSLPPIWFSVNSPSNKTGLPPRKRYFSESVINVQDSADTENISADFNTVQVDALRRTQSESEFKTRKFSILEKFRGVVHKGYPILDFIRDVWKYKHPIPGGNYSIPIQRVKGYCIPNESEENYVREPKSSVWLSRILTHLHDALPSNPSVESRFVNAVDAVKSAKDSSPGTDDREVDISEGVWRTMGAFVRNDVSILIKVPWLSKDHGLGLLAIPSQLKRKRFHIDSSPVEQCPKLKRQRTFHSSDSGTVLDSLIAQDQQLAEDDIQALKYAYELQSRSVRNYSTGLVFDHEYMSLWYIDRMGVIKSEEANFLTQPHLLLLVVAALKNANISQLGVSNRVLLLNDTIKWISGCLVLSTSRVQKLPIDIRCTANVIGRGTTIIPLKPASHSGSLSNPNALIAKISWQTKSRTPEDNFIRAIRKKLKGDDQGRDYLDNIPRLIHSLSLDMDAEELSFPPGVMEEFEEQSEPRVFRLLIFVCYEPLENVCNVEEFKKIFREVVSAHYYVYTVAGIIHRDISIDNVMFLRVGNTVVGILSDWDLAVGASRTEQDEEVMRVRSIEPGSEQTHATTSEAAPEIIQPQTEDKWARMRFKTGTTAFMALDLLQGMPLRRHLYRYDLESFFYVLVWFCASIKSKEDASGEIAKWQYSQDSEIFKYKKSFLNDEDEFNRIMNDTSPQSSAKDATPRANKACKGL
ncbi:hypothetical protein C8Q75DRAFT_867333 [Abortiporus biennis]|nr:hypothetical protein C8Q75DRAFT_867333 [Abortiporus biennis]